MADNEELENVGDNYVTVALSIVYQQNQVKIGAVTGERIAAPVSAASPAEIPDHYVVSALEFVDNNQLSVLDSFLTQVGCADVVVSENNLAALSKQLGKKFHALLENRGVTARSMRKSLFSVKGDTFGSLKRLAPSSLSIVHKIESELPSCHDGMESIMTLLNLRNMPKSVFDVRLGSLDEHMRLDSAAMEAINLLPSASLTVDLQALAPMASSQSHSPYSSLFSFLNRCKTKMGSRLLQRFLRLPLRDAQAIRARQDMTQLLSLLHVSRDALREGPLKSLPDLEGVVSKMRRQSAGLDELFRLYLFVRSLPNVTQALQQLREEAETRMQAGQEGATCSASPPFDPLSPPLLSGLAPPAADFGALLATLSAQYLQPLAALVASFGKFEELIERVVDMSALPELRVRGDFSEELQACYAQRAALDNNVQAEHRQWARKFPELKLERHPVYGFVMRSPNTSLEPQIRSHPPLQILAINKTGLYLTSPTLRSLGERDEELAQEASSLSQDIVRQALEVGATYVNLMEGVGALLAELDVFAAWGAVVACAGGDYVRPVLCGPEAMRQAVVVQGRHPLVEVQETVQAYTPNDFFVSQDASGVQIITGPNMGGKSTYLRSLGVYALLTQIGFFVPCQYAYMPIFDALYARIGGGDSIQRGVSTFMGEMLESSVILSSATPHSLILIDELGRGTSTYEGYGLACSIVLRIRNSIRCMCLFATHYHELTRLEGYCAGVVNKHVEAFVSDDKDSRGKGGLVLLYQVKPGPSLQSFGIEVARGAKFPDSVLEVARRKLRQLEGTSGGAKAGEEDGEDRQAKKQRTALGEVFASSGVSYSSPPEHVRSRLDRLIQLVA
eukprot:gene31007-37474_t